MSFCWVSLTLSVTYAECHLWWVSLMLSVTYDECHLCWVSLMLSVTYAECYIYWVVHMLSVVILNVSYAECLLCWMSLMLSVTYAECHIKPFVLSVVMQSVVMLSVVAPSEPLNLVLWPKVSNYCHRTSSPRTKAVIPKDTKGALQNCGNATYKKRFLVQNRSNLLLKIILWNTLTFQIFTINIIN
jgi:hypothetical protein